MADKFDSPEVIEAVALACMNVHGPYKGTARKGLKISDIDESVRSYIMEPYLLMARAAITAMLEATGLDKEQE